MLPLLNVLQLSTVYRKKNCFPVSYKDGDSVRQSAVSSVSADKEIGLALSSVH